MSTRRTTRDGPYGRTMSTDPSKPTDPRSLERHKSFTVDSRGSSFEFLTTQSRFETVLCPGLVLSDRTGSRTPWLKVRLSERPHGPSTPDRPLLSVGTTDRERGPVTTPLRLRVLDFWVGRNTKGLERVPCPPPYPLSCSVPPWFRPGPFTSQT